MTPPAPDPLLHLSLEALTQLTNVGLVKRAQREVAAGAHILKADNVVFEADTLLSFVMGASTITLTPASISIAGLSIKIDGAVAETAALIADN